MTINFYEISRASIVQPNTYNNRITKILMQKHEIQKFHFKIFLF